MTRRCDLKGKLNTAAVPDRHISFEAFSDDVAEMDAQARAIATWGRNVHVTFPVTTTRGEPLFYAVRILSRDVTKINMTAIFALDQVANAVDALASGAPCCVPVFAGRPADAGIDYRAVMPDAVTRADILKKLLTTGAKSATQLSLDAVLAFRKDAMAAKLKLPLSSASGATESRQVAWFFCNALNQKVFTQFGRLSSPSRLGAC